MDSDEAQMPPGQGGEDGEIDPALVAVLMALWDAWREAPDKPYSLAKLGKRAALPMSTLRRLLAQLDEAGLAGVTMTEEGRGTAWLTAAGRELAESAFGA